MSFELSASVVLWRGEEILVMKRAGGFSAGGWFIPGGHVEQGERPVESAARELFEEAGISVDSEALTLVDIMSYETGRGTANTATANTGTAHTIIYNGSCADSTEAAINEEHIYHRWMTPEAYIARFLDEGMLRGRGASESAVSLANEVARVVRAAAAARQPDYPTRFVACANLVLEVHVISERESVSLFDREIDGTGVFGACVGRFIETVDAVERLSSRMTQFLEDQP